MWRAQGTPLLQGSSHTVCVSGNGRFDYLSFVCVIG
jgi:hypothetical protein